MTRYSFSHCCCHLGAPLGHLCNFVAICCFFRSDTKGTWSKTFVYFLEFLDVIIFCSIILIVCLLLFSIIFTILYCLFLKVESILENTEHCINPWAYIPGGIYPPQNFGRGGCYLKYPPQIFDRASLAF